MKHWTRINGEWCVSPVGALAMALGSPDETKRQRVINTLADTLIARGYTEQDLRRDLGAAGNLIPLAAGGLRSRLVGYLNTLRDWDRAVAFVEQVVQPRLRSDGIASVMERALNVRFV